MPFKTPNRREVLGMAALSAASVLAPTRVLAARSVALPTRGVNIPLWLDDPDGLGNPPGIETLQFLHSTGFRTIRLPVDPDPFLDGKPSAKAAAGRLEDALDLLIDLGFSVTIDMHPMGRIGDALEQSDAADAALAAAWQHIALIAAQFPTYSIYLELLNEPPMWRDRWLDLRDRLAAAVRTQTPDHTLIWGANRYQSIDETIGCPLLEDDNCLVAVHYYTPMALTHMCQNWNADPPGTPQHVAWSPADIEADFARLARWALSEQVDVILNEFGVFNHCVESAQRAAWTGAVRAATEAYDFGWTYWEFDRGFGFMANRHSSELADPLVLEALLGR